MSTARVVLPVSVQQLHQSERVRVEEGEAGGGMGGWGG